MPALDRFQKPTRLALSRRGKAMLVAFAAMTAPALLIAPTPASAKTDVMIVFDTTGSMKSALNAAADQAEAIVEQLQGRLPDVQVALSTVRDYDRSSVSFHDSFSGRYAKYGDSGDNPWTLRSGLTTNSATINTTIRSIAREGAARGGDDAEAYGRALFESERSTEVGWRPDARRVAVLVADDVPHDDNVNEGVPGKFGTLDTGVDPGPDNIAGTADDIDWQPLLGGLNHLGMPLMMVLYHGSSELRAYWDHWTSITGGSTVDADVTTPGALAGAIVDAADRGSRADLGACPPNLFRQYSGRCSAAVTASRSFSAPEKKVGSKRLPVELSVAPKAAVSYTLNFGPPTVDEANALLSLTCKPRGEAPDDNCDGRTSVGFSLDAAKFDPPHGFSWPALDPNKIFKNRINLPKIEAKNKDVSFKLPLFSLGSGIAYQRQSVGKVDISIELETDGATSMKKLAEWALKPNSLTPWTKAASLAAGIAEAGHSTFKVYGAMLKAEQLSPALENLIHEIIKEAPKFGFKVVKVVVNGGVAFVDKTIGVVKDGPGWARDRASGAFNAVASFAGLRAHPAGARAAQHQIASTSPAPYSPLGVRPTIKLDTVPVRSFRSARLRSISSKRRSSIAGSLLGFSARVRSKPLAITAKNVRRGQKIGFATRRLDSKRGVLFTIIGPNGFQYEASMGTRKRAVAGAIKLPKSAKPGAYTLAVVDMTKATAAKRPGLIAATQVQLPKASAPRRVRVKAIKGNRVSVSAAGRRIAVTFHTTRRSGALVVNATGAKQVRGTKIKSDVPAGTKFLKVRVIDSSASPGEAKTVAFTARK